MTNKYLTDRQCRNLVAAKRYMENNPCDDHAVYVYTKNTVLNRVKTAFGNRLNNPIFSQRHHDHVMGLYRDNLKTRRGMIDGKANVESN